MKHAQTRSTEYYLGTLSFQQAHSLPWTSLRRGAAPAAAPAAQPQLCPYFALRAEIETTATHEYACRGKYQ